MVELLYRKWPSELWNILLLLPGTHRDKSFILFHIKAISGYLVSRVAPSWSRVLFVLLLWTRGKDEEVISVRRWW